jgi:hypothetical protein
VINNCDTKYAVVTSNKSIRITNQIGKCLRPKKRTTHISAHVGIIPQSSHKETNKVAGALQTRQH